MVGIDASDNELITLEIIHHFVEVLDRYFGNVCELDLIFNFHKVRTPSQLTLCILILKRKLKFFLSYSSSMENFSDKPLHVTTRNLILQKYKRLISSFHRGHFPLFYFSGNQQHQVILVSTKVTTGIRIRIWYFMPSNTFQSSLMIHNFGTQIKISSILIQTAFICGCLIHQNCSSYNCVLQAYWMLDEMLLAGELQEPSKKVPNPYLFPEFSIGFTIASMPSHVLWSRERSSFCSMLHCNRIPSF